ncbi:MAG: monovalent cation/H+ antiporter subunit D family protein, partial [Rhodospirillales bacterium]|nr:monovalent cation/H+ antiporter subunit D family protein [Rhodospirillales bacterium]
MMQTHVIQHLPALQVVIPLFGAVLAAFLHRGIVAWAVAAIATWLSLVIAGALLWQVLQAGPISYHLGGWPPPWGIEY